jgi:DNA gyrase subunit B
VETTMDPSFRTLRQVTIDIYLKNRVFSMLMGDEVPPRENLLRKTLFTQILMPNGLIRIN